MLKIHSIIVGVCGMGKKISNAVARKLRLACQASVPILKNRLRVPEIWRLYEAHSLRHDCFRGSCRFCQRGRYAFPVQRGRGVLHRFTQAGRSKLKLESHRALSACNIAGIHAQDSIGSANRSLRLRPQAWALWAGRHSEAGFSFGEARCAPLRNSSGVTPSMRRNMVMNADALL